MNDTDLDIILAVADGRLTGQAKRDALARIATDPELVEELSVQISTMDELKSLEPALMTASERTVLRRALVEQLNLQPAAPVAEAAKHRRPWWQPVLGLASAAAILIAIVVVPNMLSGSDDSGADFVAIAPESITADATPDDSTAISVPEIAGDDVVRYFADSATPPSAPVADAGTDAQSLDDGSAGARNDDPGAEGGTADEVTIDAASALTATPLTIIETEKLEGCLTSLRSVLPPGDLLPRAATVDDNGFIVHLGISTADGIEYAASIELESCTIVDISR